MKIVDTHQHLWDLDLFHYAGLEQLPVLNRYFRMNDYRDATDGLAIEKSVHLEADVDEPFMLEETMHLLRLADRADNPLEGVVACGRPESKEFRAY
jgi:predicted TIM-barrel fold metal-dependent hydrolase